MKGLPHYLSDKTEFDVSSEGPSSALSLPIPDEGGVRSKLRILFHRICSESILFFLSATHTGNSLKF